MLPDTVIGDISLIPDGELMLSLIKRATLKAMKRHYLLGNPMVSWKDGKVHYVNKEEMAIILSDNGISLD